MKKIIVSLVLCGVAGIASAQQASQGQTQSTNTNSVSQAQTNGNTQAITFTSPSAVQTTIDQHVSGNTSASETIKNTPSVAGPNLVTSNDTCMGSTSGSINVAGFGFGAGTSWTDTNCVMLKNSREMWNMGMKAAALARMCMDADNKTALELTGFECPQTTREREQKAKK